MKVSDSWNDHSLHSVSKLINKPQPRGIREEKLRQGLLQKAEALKFNPSKISPHVSNIGELAGKTLLLEVDPTTLKNNVIKHLTENNITVSL